MNDRELATFILLCLLVIAVLTYPKTRADIPGLTKQLFLSKLTALLALFVASIVAAVCIAHSLGLWTSSLAGATVLWFLFVGFAWFINLNDAGNDPDFFRKRFLETLGISALFEFFLNAQSLPLALELPLQTVVVLLAAVSAYAATKEETKPVATFGSVLLGITATGLFLFTVIRLATTWSDVDKSALLNELLMPIWLTASVIPILYAFALFMIYESLFLRMSFLNERSPASCRAKVGTILGLRGALVDVAQFRGVPVRLAARAKSVRDARGAVAQFKHERAADIAARQEARRTLELNAGRPGVDSEGLVLDRREFAETKEALRWLATCHMGWYQQEGRPDTYRADLLEVLQSMDDEQFKFVTPEPVVTQVRKNGKAWYAYRRTPSGHVFGIGAVGAPPSQWFFDGPEAPKGFPAQGSPGWTDFMSPDRPEWRSEPDT